MTDEIKGLVSRFEAINGPRDLASWEDHLADLRQAASLLTLSDEARVRAERERDELDRKYRAQFKATSDACNIADEERERADASEALVRELVEGLRPFGVLAESIPASWEDTDIFFDGRFKVGAFRKAQALILRAEGDGSSVAESAAPVASQPGCSAAQSLDGGEG